MKGVCSFTLLIARICLGLIFLLAGVGKFMDYQGTAQEMASKGMTMVPLFLYAAVIVETLGGLALILGWFTRPAAGILALFLIPVTWIFHDFWNAPDAERALQMAMFLKNLAIIGGLLYAVGAGAGKFSVDGWRERSSEPGKV